MKQLKLKGFIFLFFLTESLTLPTKPLDIDNFQDTQKFIEDNVEYLTIITFAQYVQEATFKEMEMLVKEMIEFRDKCLADRTLPHWAKLAINILQESICAIEGLPQKYNFSHCRSKRDFERSCFLYKKADVGFLPPLPTADPEKKCQNYQQKKDLYLNNYLYEVARRNPFVFSPTLLNVAACFEEVVKTCCEEQDVASCFQTRKKSKYSAKVRHDVPQIEFKELIFLLEDISYKFDGCCKGDTVQCVQVMSKVMSHICTKQSSTSSKIRECCEKTASVYHECLIYLDKEKKPKDLSLREAKFTDSKDKIHDTFEDNYWRFSVLILNEEKEEEKFNETTEKSLKMVQQECERFHNLGKDDLKHQKSWAALAMCYAQSKQFACVDNLGDLVLGELCGVNRNRTINPAVEQCCKSSFAFRRHCFQDLKADETYVPPLTSQDLFILHADLFLVDLVKLNPQCTDEELRSLLTDFTNVLVKCYKAEGPEACFNEECPKLEAKSQAASEI
ncbi:LOW QUALITY PROTEIN: afamin-like [Dugong dugon]